MRHRAGQRRLPSELPTGNAAGISCNAHILRASTLAAGLEGAFQQHEHGARHLVTH